MRAWKVLALTVLMTAGLIALAVVLRGASARFVAQYWLEQIDAVPDDRALALMEQIAALDEAGIPILVAALGSPRAAVSRAAAEVLAEQLHRWQNQPGPGGVRKQVALAAALGERVSEFGPAARRDAAQLATRLLLVLPDDDAAGRGRLIAACEKVLQAGSAGVSPGDLSVGVPPTDRSAGVPPGNRSAGVPPAQSVRDGLAPGDRVERRHSPLPAEDAIPELAQLPGGGLPVDPLSATAAPFLLRQPADSRPLAAERGPMNRALVGEGVPEAAIVRPMSVAQPETAVRGTGAVQPVGDLVRADTVELMRQLQATDESAVAARAELIRRKFTPAHLEAARRLFHADMEVRKGLARTLPETPGLDAVPWLLWLARDPEADVRLLAVTLLATTADPAVLEQVEAIARNDSDPRVQQLAERLGRPRGAP